ncbi:lipopolysaccharide-binding protein-like [Corticium candelabrum]|uniref:lipopolysaccharide-binding protein-like n=1 Tax=Corticium candelabrum TaxID=121492 RepID=UPI002E25FB87|nr:lipopolysaccharide-binding protein-like [Corticium candelabrum]
MMETKLLTVCLSFLVSVSLANNPGFVVRLTEHGLQYVRDLALQLLREELQHMDIPDQRGESGTPIGKIDYTLSSIRVESATVASLDISLDSGSGIRVSTSGVSLRMKADWRYKNRGFIHISDHGSIDLAIAVDLSLTGTSEMTANGQPTASVVRCEFNVQNVDVHFHGGASWLYNLFSGHVEKAIKTNLQSQACSKITETLNRNGQKAMETLDLIEEVGNDIQLDLRLVQSPIFESNYLESLQKGQFSYHKSPSLNFSPQPLSVPTYLSGQMFYMFVTEAMLNSAGEVYQKSGKLKLKITSDEISSSSFFQLNTDTIAGLIPGSTLKSKFPNMGMQLVVTVTQAPKFTICTDSIKSVISTDMIAYVIHPDGNLTYVFTLGLVLNSTLGLWVENTDGRLYLGLTKNITVIHGAVTVKDSIIGHFSGENIEAWLNLGVPFILHGIQTKGIPIPTVRALTFVDPHITLLEGSLAIGTDVKYDMSQS